MLITYELLKQHNACKSQASRFREMFPDGMQPTIENLADLQAEELDVLWLSRLLPAEGIGSARHFALICAEDVAHLCADPRRVDKALGVVRRRVANPASVSNKQLAAAWDAALAAIRATARDAALAATRAAIRATALAATRDAALAATRDAALAATISRYIAHLSAMLLECE
jgi:hypothetical protein